MGLARVNEAFGVGVRVVARGREMRDVRESKKGEGRAERGGNKAKRKELKTDGVNYRVTVTQS